MTGHWQLLASTRVPMQEMVAIDYLYVANWSLWTDIKVLLRTVRLVVSATAVALTAAQVHGHHANRRRTLTGRGGKLEVNRHHPPVGEAIQHS